MAKIFISYSRKDTDQVDSLIKFLESANHDVWVDTQDICAGSQWQTSIVQGIVESDFFIIALSKNSTKSDNVRRELVIAVNHKKEIIPICIQEVELPPEMQYQLAGIQRINFDKDSQKDRAALLSVLEKEGSDVQRKLTISKAKSSIRNNLVWKVLGLLVLVSSIVAVTLFVRESIKKPPEAPEIIEPIVGLTAQSTATPADIQLAISVKEKDERPHVELDIKALNSGDEVVYLTKANIRIQDFQSFSFRGCFPLQGGSGPIYPSETYNINISDLDRGKTENFDISYEVPPDKPNRFKIDLLPRTEYGHWIIYKINLAFTEVDGDQILEPKPMIFISKDWEDPATSAKDLYGYQLSDDDILEKYKYLLDPKNNVACCTSEEELKKIVQECYKENLRRVTDIFSEEDMILSEQAEVIFNEWKKAME